MTQFNLDTPINPTTTSGSTLCTVLSSWRDALHTCHSGVNRPTYVTAGMIWLDTSTTPWYLYLYDGSNDISLGSLQTLYNVYVPGAVLLDQGALFDDIKQVATDTITGVVELAAAGETMGGTDNTRAITPAGLASSLNTSAVSGSTKWPGGMILNWGSGSIGGSSSAAVTFDSAYTTSVLSIQTTPIGPTPGGGEGDFWGVNGVTTTGFTLWNRYNGGKNYTYLAIGY